MQVDPSVRKRLAMDEAGMVSRTGSTMVPPGVLMLTLGKGEEGDVVHSPTSSSGSKRAKTVSEDASDVRSAASLEEDRRVQ